MVLSKYPYKKYLFFIHLLDFRKNNSEERNPDKPWFSLNKI